MNEKKIAYTKNVLVNTAILMMTFQRLNKIQINMEYSEDVQNLEIFLKDSVLNYNIELCRKLVKLLCLIYINNNKLSQL